MKIIHWDKRHSYIIPENDQPHKSHIEYIEKQTLSVFRVFTGHTEPLEVTQKTKCSVSTSYPPYFILMAACSTYVASALTVQIKTSRFAQGQTPGDDKHILLPF